MAGRKRKPTALHLVEGTANVTRHRDREGEPVVSGLPVKPKSLTGRASEIWDEAMKYASWLTVADSQCLANWARVTAELEECDIKRVSASLLSQQRAYGSSLGFDPSSRSRINVKSNGKTEDENDKYYA